jgi:hypothetical protein
MRPVLADQVRLVHAVSGRVRVHLPSWLGAERERVAAQLQGVVGVLGAQFSATTSNLLVHVDPARMDAASVLALVQRLVWGEAVRCGRNATTSVTARAAPSRPARRDGAPSADVPIAGRLLALGRWILRMVIGSAQPAGARTIVGQQPPAQRGSAAMRILLAVLVPGAVELALHGMVAFAHGVLVGDWAAMGQVLGIAIRLYVPI